MRYAVTLGTNTLRSDRSHLVPVFEAFEKFYC